MTVVQVLAPAVRAVLGSDLPIQLQAWDGSTVGPPEAPLRLKITRRRAIRRLLWSPNELGLARAYVSGDLQVQGDMFTGLQVLQRLALADGAAATATGHPSDAAHARRAVSVAALKLGALGPPPRPPAEEARLSGHQHSKARDAAAIAHHYDVGNDFYRLVLGESMTYSCAYWLQEPGPSYELSDAQFAKCELVARKLGLAEGMRVLDVGCGWGTFALHAARTYGARVVGVTLSREQAGYARKRMAQHGVADLVEIRIQDYRDVRDGPYDAIASIGMAEHVGATMLPSYTAGLFALLGPGGRLLNHAIARRPGPPARARRNSFIDRYVFPDGELEPLATMIDAIEDAGFEVRDVQSLREHYALTLRAWVANLEQNWDQAVTVSSLARARIWRLYMAASALAFETNRIGVNQVLAVKPDSAGVSGLPRVRDYSISQPERARDDLA